MMRAEEFDAMVEGAWNALPQAFKAQLQNVEVVVEEWPDATTLRLAHLHNPMSLLGFYHGVPLTKRGAHYQMVTPDKISLYRQPITQSCGNLDELPVLITRVLRHEIAHHFGISDARLHEIGAY